MSLDVWTRKAAEVLVRRRKEAMEAAFFPYLPAEARAEEMARIAEALAALAGEEDDEGAAAEREAERLARIREAQEAIARLGL